MNKTVFMHHLVEKNLGYLRVTDAIAACISRSYIMEYIAQHPFERAARGLYKMQDAWDDGMYVLQTIYKKAIFSHESALYLHNLAVREPVQYSITLQAGSGSAALVAEGVKVYKIKKSLFLMGLLEVQTPVGHFVRAYNAERTLCDLLRSRRSIESQDIQYAFTAYVQTNKKNIPLLMHYAKHFSVTERIRTYLEMLLP